MNREDYEDKFLPKEERGLWKVNDVSTKETTSDRNDQTANDRTTAPKTFDRNIVFDLIDCLNRPPVTITSDYVKIVNRISSWLATAASMVTNALHYVAGSGPTWIDASFPEQGLGSSSTSVRQPQIIGDGLESSESVRNSVNMVRNSVFDVVNKVSAFIARARNAGFSPPSNPFTLAMSFNKGRVGFSPVNVSSTDIMSIMKNIPLYMKLLDEDRLGRFDLDKNIVHAAQLSSAKLSLDGFGGSGDAVADLARLLPDADEVKAQRAARALSIFDFSKRIPQVLFTAHYAPAGVPNGVIVGWKKVPDASGYVVTRKSTFNQKISTYELTEDDIKRDTTRLKEYVRAWILSFYDSIDERNISIFLDPVVQNDAYFFYDVQAYQNRHDTPGTIFNVETSPIFISQSQRIEIRKQMEELDPGSGADTISSYPILAHFLLGDSKNDWILAAVNTRQSISRGDTRTTTRGYSYLAAQLDFIFSQSDAGKFVVPKDRSPGPIFANIERFIAKFGVNQTMIEMLQETGALYHFDGKDANDNYLFNVSGKVDASSSGLVATVVSAVDPETMTLDLKKLATNLPLLLSGQFVRAKQGIGSFSKNDFKGSSEIVVPISGEFDKPTDELAEEEIQFLKNIDKIGVGYADLTTVDGLGIFMRVIRIFSDIGPGRGTPVINKPDPSPIDPILPPAPPPVNRSPPPSQPIDPPVRRDKPPKEDQPPEEKLDVHNKPKKGRGSQGGLDF